MTHRIFLLPTCMILLLALLLPSCGSEDPTEPPVGEETGIAGVITDDETGAPVAGVMITTDPGTHSVISKADGSYSLAPISPGTYDVQFEKTGYKSREIEVTVLSGRKTQVDVLLEPGTGTSGGSNADSITVLSFDGNDDMIVIPDSDASDLSSGNFTIEMWIRPTGFDGTWNCLVGHGPSNANLDYLLGIQGKNPMFHVRNYDAGMRDSLVFEADRWYHFAAVQDVDAKEVRIYIDGKLESEGDLAGGGELTTADVFVGARERFGSGNGDLFFEGEMVELRFWDKARTPEQVTADMKKTMRGNESGLVGYWPMTEGKGTVVTDGSGKNEDGNTVGSPDWVKVKNPMKSE